MTGRESISVVDPRADDVGHVLERHHAYANQHSPPDHVHALDVSGLLDPAVTLFGFRDEGARLLGIGALKELGDGHAELKSMHTLAEARGRGVAGALVDHLVAIARDRGLTRVSLETGANDAFAPAWSLYRARGFDLCEAFPPYVATSESHFMTLDLRTKRKKALSP